ncbi:hypothetical protein MPH_08982 [Macrophomina phaseolina MS6]|uniref:Uncharacterized protein n=1 Tax=Macrophomina phaseolina (strain MS6) TaxID=1126212 RepID=K2SAE8_MACPH|nr:hypothetical protein MPH_08982 [Macrophomina phaseolina MS6]
MYARGLESQVAQARHEVQNLQAQLAVILRELEQLRRSSKNDSDTLFTAQRELDRANARTGAYEKIIEAMFRNHPTSPLDCPLSWQNLVQENEQNKLRIQELEYAITLERESSSECYDDTEHHKEHEEDLANGHPAAPMHY